MKKLLCVSGLIAGLIISANVMASSTSLGPNQDLFITNHTNSDMTSKISGHCSSEVLGQAGVTPKGGVSDITPNQILLACAVSILKGTPCSADIYMSNNCSGTSIGTVTFDMKTGITGVTGLNPNYTIDYSGFAATISGGPALASR
jgi:hypothetical protein